MIWACCPWNANQRSLMHDFSQARKSESHRESCAGGFEVMIRARRPGIPGISMYQLGKISHKYLRVVPENCWYLLFTSINSSLSSNYTPEDLSYHRLNAYSLCCLCLFATVCPIICLLVCHGVFWTCRHCRRPWPRRCRGHWRRPLDDAISHV